MKVEPLAIAGAWVVTPTIHSDSRGAFLEWFASSAFEAAVGHRMPLAQANCSVSDRGVLRGVHFADVPPGQAKYVTCLSGAVLDVIVDLRLGSPSFGHWQAERLDAQDRRAVYLAAGLGHAVLALEDASTVVYLCSTGYAPEREHEVHPLDPGLDIAWPIADVTLSAKDAAAPTLAEAAAAGILPRYDAWMEHELQQRTSTG